MMKNTIFLGNILSPPLSLYPPPQQEAKFIRVTGINQGKTEKGAETDPVPDYLLDPERAATIY